MDANGIPSACELLMAVLPSLLGTLIGGAITLVSTQMNAKHQMDLEDKRERAAREDDNRRFKLDCLARLQEAVQHCMRFTSKCYQQIFALAKDGRQWRDWIVDSDIDEKHRQLMEDIHLLSYRVNEHRLRKAIDAFCESVYAVTVDSCDAEQLASAMNDLSRKYDVAMVLLGEMIGACVKG